MKPVKAIEPASDRLIHRALDILRSGGIVAYPTETFYGLGVKYDREETLKRLYALKRRPRHRALPLIIGSKSLLPLITESVSSAAVALMEKFWPGPLTLVLQARETLSPFITAGTGKVAVRVPGESFAFRMAANADFPFTATSANLSGMPPARDIRTVIEYFEDAIDLIVDGGPSPGALPSTIVDVTTDAALILREGAVKKESLLSPEG